MTLSTLQNATSTTLYSFIQHPYLIKTKPLAINQFILLLMGLLFMQKFWYN